MANDNALTELGIEPIQARELTSNQRRRLLNFLLRWEQFDDLHACLDALTAIAPGRVSLFDLRVQAFLAQGRPADALRVMQARLQRKTSLTARALLARVHLARGDVDTAHRIARALVEERAESVTSWGLLGEVELARGNIDGALTAYRRLDELRPQSRTYLLGMMSLYRASDDWVTASGYAVRLLRSASDERPLSVAYLRQLRAYFAASGEETRVADLETALAERYQAELSALREALPPGRGPRHTPSTRAARSTEVDRETTLLTLDQVPVSADERERIAEATRRLFGFESLLPGQMETIAAVLRGEDVLTILPTGGGKSLCYQLPALLAEHGITLVISPLIALMKDQVDSLPGGIRRRVTTINSSLERDAMQRRLEQVMAGNYRLVYAAPERLRQPAFLHALRQAGVNRLVIDEAHCLSVWGHDFRPDYLNIGQARESLGNPPLLAMTATAPPRIRRDIVHHLGNMRIVAGDVTRLNLRLEVFYARNSDDKLRRLLAFCQEEPGSGIVYAGTRARCERLAALLCSQGVSAGHYHAGIPNRAQLQDDFMTGRIRIVVATIAFGLGIDKPDIRFIVHFVPSNSLEAYYQEAGRAGRDGLPSRCLLMYAPSDRGMLTRRARQDALPVEFLRAVYGAVKRRLGENTIGRVAAADLERDLRAEKTRIRVALSLLEKAALLRRGPDFPRSVTLCLTAGVRDGAVPPDLEGLRRAAHLRVGQSLTFDLVGAAREAGIPLDEVERRLLEWSDAGWLTYYPAGRDWLLELLPPPADAATRVATLLEQYETVQVQRVDEIAAYAQTGRCRHGYLNAYLGGRTIAHCAACDNCVDVPAPSATVLPTEREQLLAILRCAAGSEWSWGRGSLTRILRGDDGARGGRPPLHEKARQNAAFGVLAFRSSTAIKRMLNLLENGGFLQERRLEHGGAVLELTPAGRAALQDPTMLDEIAQLARNVAGKFLRIGQEFGG